VDVFSGVVTMQLRCDGQFFNRLVQIIYDCKNERIT